MEKVSQTPWMDFVILHGIINLTLCIQMDTHTSMYLIEKTEQFDKWLRNLKVVKGKANILGRLRRIESGNLGDYKSITDKIKELRFFIGPGYRIYFAFRDKTVILLLSGGGKSSQKRDIDKAVEILESQEA